VKLSVFVQFKSRFKLNGIPQICLVLKRAAPKLKGTMSNKKSKAEMLADSNDMTPVAGTVDVDIPANVLWACFTQANRWPRWNKCMFWALNRSLILGKRLIWCFDPIRKWYLYKMPAIAKIVELEKEKKVTWEVTALPGFYARHTYHIEDLGNGRSRFGSWEKAMGWNFRLMKRFWISHFTFVKDRSLEGVRFLEEVYLQKGKIDKTTLKPKNYWPFWITVLLLLLILIGGTFASWFYYSYVRMTTTELAPGVHAVFGGGSNSLVMQEGEKILLVDTKFSPGAENLHDWISQNMGNSVTTIINTHHHYDHSLGNILYPKAQIFAHENVPKLMMLSDSSWWNQYPNSVPNNLILQTETLKVGKHEIVLTHSGVGHTHGDLWVYLPKQNLVVTGDLVFHTYYPFFDLSEGGVSIPKMIKIVRHIANKYPTARFLPGHGPLAKASDLLVYADYLEFLYDSVEQAYKKGLSEDETVEKIDLSKWNLHILPSFHNQKMTWATATNNIRWVCRIHNKQKAGY